MSVRRMFMRAILVASLVPILSLFALAQTTGVGGIVGSVKDSTGAVIPGVTVSLSNPGVIGANQTGVTDESGAYRFLRLVPGKYTVKAELPGFRTTVKEGVTVDADANARVDLSLEVGAVSDVVNVTS